jgi:protein-disulfide isomerase/uncharacterized membrane protein
MVTEQTAVIPRWPFVVGLVAALLGCGLAVELTQLHFRLNENPDFESFCNVGARVNCDAVARSAYSSLFGVPLSLWGVLGYLAIAGVSGWGIRSRTHRPILPLLVLCSVCGVASVILSLISSLAVKSLCLLCAATWIIDLVLFASAVVLARGGRLGCSFAELRTLLSREPAWGLVTSIGGVLVVAVTIAVTPRTEAKGIAAPVSTLSRAAERRMQIPKVAVPSGVDEDGHHYVGASHPKLSITEYSDYQCPYCSREHARLRGLVAKYPEAIRLVHRHYPLDNDCNPAVPTTFHPHACHYARLASCAGEAGKFWEANDYLFEHGHDSVRVTAAVLAEAIGVSVTELEACLTMRGTSSVRADIDAGIQLAIKGTPTLVVDGKTYTGNLPKSVLLPYPMP